MRREVFIFLLFGFFNPTLCQKKKMSRGAKRSNKKKETKYRNQNTASIIYHGQHNGCDGVGINQNMIILVVFLVGKQGWCHLSRFSLTLL